MIGDVTLTRGDAVDLDVSVDAYYVRPDVSWHASDPSVASVDEDGVVTFHVNDASVEITAISVADPRRRDAVTVSAAVEPYVVTSFDPTPEEDEEFGSQVAMMADGAVLFIAADSAIDGTDDVGSVVVFEREGPDYVAGQRIVPPGEWLVGYGYLGASLASSHDGSVLVVGSSATVDGEEFAGALHVYRQATPETPYVHSQVITAPGGATEDEYFGMNLELASDGTTLFVGAYDGDFGSDEDDDYVHGFRYDGNQGAFVLFQTLTDTDLGFEASADSNFGARMAFVDETGDLIVSAKNAGKGYVYRFERLDDGTFGLPPERHEGVRENAETHGTNVSARGDGSVVIASSALNRFPNEPVLYVYADSEGALSRTDVYVETVDGSSGLPRLGFYNQTFSSDGNRLLATGGGAGDHQVLVYAVADEGTLTLLDRLASTQAHGLADGRGQLAASGDFGVIVAGDDGASPGDVSRAGQVFVITYPFW